MGKRVPASKQLFIMKKQGRSENTAKKIENGLYAKNTIFLKKVLQKRNLSCILILAVTLIA